MSAPAEASVRRRSSLRTVLIAVALVVGALIAAGVVASRGTPAEQAVVGSGTDIVPLDERPPPDKSFALPPLTLDGFADGPAVDLTDLRGEPHVVNFWATWCAPCVREMPEFQQAAKDYEGAVTFLGVNHQDSHLNAEPFVERLGVEYPLAADPTGALYRQIANFGMPTTLFVDPDGIVRYRYTGPLDRSELAELLEAHLGVTP